MERITLEEYCKLRTDDQLKQELAGLNWAIDIMDCFNVGDILMRQAVEKELERRKKL